MCTLGILSSIKLDFKKLIKTLSAVQWCTGQLTARMFHFQLRSFCVEFALIPVSV